MKSACLHDLSVNMVGAPDVYSKPAVPVFDGDEIKDWIIPKGTVLEGPEALLRVMHGQAEPIDEECAKACGMDPAQLRRTQRVNLSAERGIRTKKDMDLFMAGVIDGYGPGDTPAKTVYEPGENYQKWLDAKAKLAKKDNDE